MAFIEEAHVDDVGTIFRVTVYDTTSSGGSTVADISGATVKQFTFKRPDGTTFTKTACGMHSRSPVVQYSIHNGGAGPAVLY